METTFENHEHCESIRLLNENKELKQKLEELTKDANKIIFYVFDNTIVLNEYPEVEKMCLQFLDRYGGSIKVIDPCLEKGEFDLNPCNINTLKHT